MAKESVIYLKVESKFYDDKLKRAVQGMQHFEQQCEQAGKSLSDADQKTVEYIKALGDMGTVATSSTGKLNEMKKAFTELSVQYQNLTKAEKQSPYGKALAGSLDQLKGRISNLQGDLNKAQADMTGFGDAFKQVGAKMGIPMDMFSKFGPYVAAGGAALKVATDAFKQNELIMDEWGRTTEAASSIYDGFLNALNTGDFSNFFKNMGKIVSSARAAYDALDELGTFNAFNKIQIEGARTNFTEAMAAYREGSGSKEDVQAAADRLKNEMQTRQDKEQAAYIAAIKELAAKRGVDEEMLQKALSGTYGDYETLKNTQMTGVETQYHSAGPFGGVYTTETKFAVTEEEKLGEMLRKLSDDELARIQQLGATAQATATEIAQIDKQVVRILGQEQNNQSTASKAIASGFKFSNPAGMPEAGSLADLERQAALVRNSMSGATTADEYQEMQAHLDSIIQKMKELRGEKEVTFTPGSLNDLNQQLREAQEILANCAPNTEAWATALQDVADKTAAVQALQAKMGNGVQSTTADAKDMHKAFSAAASAVATVGGALQQIEDPAAKVAGIIAAAVAQVALAFASSLKGAVGPWDYIAAATAGLATMISTITAIKSITANAKGYAEGGMVGGNSYSGDNIVARLNSGEGVLTAQGVQNAANMANGLSNGGGGGSSQPYLTGDVILLGVNNYLGRSGQGEIVTTSMLRRAGVNL